MIIFLFGPVAFVMSRQHFNRRGGLFSKLTCPKDKLELTLELLFNLIAPNRPIKIGPVSNACLNRDMMAKCSSSKPEIAIPCNFGETTCFAVADAWKSSLIVSVISKTKERRAREEIPPDTDLCKNILALQAVVLPFIQNRDTYTILNPRVAPWFFTDDLSGCDVFVATAVNRGSRPMVIHSNRLLYIRNLAKDLQSKGEDVDEMLKRISKSDGYEWKVIARVYYGPTTETGKEKIGLNRYADEHRGIKLIGYQKIPGWKNENFAFFGHYIGPKAIAKARGYQPCWRFIFKGYSTGTILSKFRVSAKGDLF